MRRILIIFSFTFQLAALAQPAAPLDSLFFNFRKQLNADDTAAWNTLAKLQTYTANSRPAQVYYLLCKASGFVKEGEREQAFGACMDALDLARGSGADSLIYRAYYGIGALYMEFSDLPRALPYLNKAVLLERSVKNLNDRILVYKDIALLNSYLDRNEEAINYFLKMEPLIIAAGNKKFLGNTYNNIGINYVDLHDSSKALYYYRKSMAVRKEINDAHGIAQVENNLGTLYLAWDQYEKALSYFERGLKLRKKANVAQSGIIESNINIGKAWYKLKQMAKARKYLEEARAGALQLGAIELERRADEELLAIYSASGDYQKAFDLQSRFFLIKDSLYGLDKKEEISRMSFEGKLREDSLKHEQARQKDAAVHDEKERRATLIRNISISGFLGVLVVAFVLFAQVKRIRAANRTIADQKDQIEQKQKEVLDSIHYAKRIQQSLLPSAKIIEKNLRRLRGNS